jgi:glutamate-1-semialdehyde 2,1-aminomutase
MTMHDKFSNYKDQLFKEYENTFIKSKEIFEVNKEYFPNKVSHAGRFYEPFPVFISKGQGSTLTTVEGKKLIDLWQGHFTNIFGYDKEASNKMSDLIKETNLNQTGQFHIYEGELAKKLRDITKHENFVFTTSGSLATLYATFLGLSYTKRDKVLKLDGGWHGVQPYGLKGVRYPNGIYHAETEYSGLNEYFDNSVLTTPMNDCQKLEDLFKNSGDKIGVFLLELVLGNSGMIVSSKEFVQLARSLCDKYGCILVADELVTGFRVKHGLMSDLYGINADITTLGKSMSGGLPLACIAGRRELFDAVKLQNKFRLGIDAGTFSSHPLSLFASLNVIKKMESDLGMFDKTIQNMTYLRNKLEIVFKKHNIAAHITGSSIDKDIPNFPIGTVRYIKNTETYDYKNPLSHWDSETTDIQFRNNITKIAFILRGYFTWQGLGVMTDAISHKEIDNFVNNYDNFASEIAPFFQIN